MSLRTFLRPPLDSLWRWGWLILPLLAAILAGAAAGVLVILSQGLPQVEELQTYEPSTLSTLLADDGKAFWTLGTERRIPVPLDRIPPLLVKAVVAVEDSRFYEHHGVDLKGIARALWRDIVTGSLAQGGSTITQQLSRVLFLTSEKSLTRKLREAVLAMQIERRYGKDEILTLYLNQIYLGEGAYGVEAAARTYFGKGVEDLTLSECSLLAGLPKGPSYYSPLAHPERAEARRRVVLGRLAAEGVIAPGELEEALASPPVLSPSSPRTAVGAYFAEQVRRELEERLGENLLYRGGITVRTTLNRELQEAAEEAVRDGIAAYEKRHPAGKAKPGEAPAEPVQAALVALSPATGEVKALVGGRDFAASPYDRAASARRQPGSSFKPILYAAALSAGMTPATLLSDVPRVYRQKGSPPWKPENYSRRYHGEVTMRTALEESLNAASVDLLVRTGYPPVRETARRLGLTAEIQPYPSAALGVFDASLLEMTSAYAAFDNEGMRVAPRLWRSASGKEGETLLPEEAPLITEAVSPVTAFLTSNLLIGVVERGTARGAASLGTPVAGKTGTTQDYKDAWFIGYSPSLAAGVWVGFDTPRTLGRGEAGSRAALPIWTAFMRRALAGVPSARFSIPPGVEMAEVDPTTGALAGEGCPDRVMEGFAAGTAPTAPCDPARHRPALTEPPLD